jgi:hypothetical protein
MFPMRTLARDGTRHAPPPETDVICMSCLHMPVDRKALLAALRSVAPQSRVAPVATGEDGFVALVVDPAALHVVGVLPALTAHLACAGIVCESVTANALHVAAERAEEAARILHSVATSAARIADAAPRSSARPTFCLPTWKSGRRTGPTS